MKLTITTTATITTATPTTITTLRLLLLLKNPQQINVKWSFIKFQLHHNGDNKEMIQLFTVTI